VNPFNTQFIELHNIYVVYVASKADNLSYVIFPKVFHPDVVANIPFPSTLDILIV